MRIWGTARGDFSGRSTIANICCRPLSNWSTTWTDSAVRSYLEDLAQTKIAAVHPLQRTAGMDLREVKETYGDRFCIIGNIDSSRTLPYGTPEEVAAEVRDAIDIAAPGGGYILASDHSLHDGISVENITMMFQLGAEYGRAVYR